jgi:type III secretory pathway component EscR
MQFCKYKMVLLLMMGLIRYSYGQNQSGNFIYDPVFWEESLRLSSNQKNKIEEINTEFYQKVKSLEKSDDSYRSQLEEYLQTRSHQIFETFHNRQKKKWEKIVAAFAA